jgi:MHS family shikimate/dehydroshikimate transporter-like MFS transporter
MRQSDAMLRRVRLASLIGTTIEWYDFFIYGTAAALVFNKLFFPGIDPLAGTLAALATFAVGFVARPIGGMIFGHFGDRIGRRPVLIATLTTMGVATFLVGVIPTYAAVGVWAPIVLVALRVFQGIGLGGEWGGAVLMTVEHAPADKRGRYGAWPQLGVPVGLLLSTGVFAVVSAVTGPAFGDWGWRIPFLLSIALVVFGLLLRLSIDETPAFTELARAHAIARTPVFDVFRYDAKTLLLVVGSRFAENGSFFIFTVLVLSYGTKTLGIDRSTILLGVTLGAALTIVTLPLFASLTDRVGRRPVFLFGAIFTGAFAFPFFWLLETRSPLLVCASICIALCIGWSAMYAPQAPFFAELFSTRVRYSGMSTGAQLIAIVAGGPAPLIATALLAWTHGASWPVGLWLVGTALITIVSVTLAPETRGRDLQFDSSISPLSNVAIVSA